MGVKKVTKLFRLIGVLALCVFSTHSYSQDSTVSVQGYDLVYTYNPDSVGLEKNELELICKAFSDFYNAIVSKNYEAYLNCLSQKSQDTIPKVKLEKKYQKFIGYSVSLKDTVEIYEVITEGNPPSFETANVAIIIRMKSWTVEKRVGFDPVKFHRLQNSEDLLGLFLVKENGEYKVSIPW